MCGIAGFIDWNMNNDFNTTIHSMTNTLHHRGPDDYGYYVNPPIALGHTRLVVVDLIGGKQPMTRYKGDNPVTLVYNGELYNAIELRNELEARGHKFKTNNSDTEVVLMAYLEWGEECVKHFNGIFAFAIWDEQIKQLILGRDRLGVKPLFYALRNNTIIFGSELKALLAHPLIKPELDSNGLAEILLLGPSRTPGNGVFKNILELRAGQILIYTKNTFKTSTYWKLESHEHQDNFEDTVQFIRHLLEDIVARQLTADVSICTFLSGGLDSSGLSALAAKNVSHIDTYSVDYKDNSLYFKSNLFQPESDTLYAKEVSNHLNTTHHSVIIDNHKLAEALMDSLYANDIPGMADIDSSLLLFSKEVKNKFVVALSGECADEVFGGYPWFHKQDMICRDTFPWIRMIDEKLDFINKDIIHFINPKKYLEENYRKSLEEVPTLKGETGFKKRLREISYFSLTRFMPTLLDRKDRMSMACGLEVRVPFSDHRLVEYVWNIPWEMKNCDGIEKGILRRALAGLLPQDVLYRRKSPYPKTYNPAYYSNVKNKIMEILHDPDSPILKFINKDKLVNALAQNNTIFTTPWFGQLMGDAQYLAFLFQLNEWLKGYKITI